VTAWEWTPDDFGLRPCTPEELRADGPQKSAAVIRRVLAGEDGAARRIVLANAAAALLAANRVGSPREGVARAGEALASGRARDVLHALIEYTNEVG
jgi:anthranilate phosphoribosyltransferase